jgi:hypothetical protein
MPVHCNFLELPVANRKSALENQNSDGVLAQLVEHRNGIAGVRGSNPLGSTDFGTKFWSLGDENGASREAAT